MRAAAMACVAALLLAGCKNAPRPAATPASTGADSAVPAPPAVPRTDARPALALPDAAGMRSASQVIHAAYGSRSVVLRTAIESAPGRLDVVGVTATGQRVFSAHYDGRSIDARKSPFVPEQLDPERVLADMQLALWPLAAVQAAFRERGLTVTEPFPGVRRLSRADRLLAEVHYASDDPWSGRLWFVSFEFDYSLTIDTTTN
jgi:hypothetical protein